MRRLLMINVLLLVLAGGILLAQTHPALPASRLDQVRRQSLAFEQWTWVALAWGPENLTRLRLGGSLNLVPSHSGTPHQGSSFISWSAWLATPSARRYQVLHQRTAHAALVQSLVWAEVLIIPVLLGFLCYRRLVGPLGRLRPSTTKGSARWLSRTEIRALRPRADQAPLVLGTVTRRLVALPEAEVYQHALVVGPPGSGKSASLFIPPLLEERGRRSLVIVDPKAELIERTYAAVAHHHDVAILNFLDPAVSIGYNPLAWVHDPLSAGFFADSWVSNTGTSQESFWNDTAKQLIAAASLHLVTVLTRDGGATLNDLALFLTGQEPDAILQAFHDSPSGEARRLGEQFLRSMQHNQRLLGSIFTGLPLRFSILGDARVRAVTGHNELDFTRLVDLDQRPLALYLALDHTMAHLLTPLSACFFTQLFTALMGTAYRQPSKELPRPVLCLIDEFGNVGAIPQMPRWLSTIRSAKMGCVLAVQDLAQLSAIYGNDHRQVIVTACTTRIGLAGMVGADARWFSEQTGTATVVTRSAGTNRKRGEVRAQSGNEGQSESSQPLLTPGEVTRLRTDQLLVLAGNRQPALLRQRRWYQDRWLRRLGGQRLSDGRLVPAGGPRRSEPLAVRPDTEEPDALEQAWWQEDALAERATLPPPTAPPKAPPELVPNTQDSIPEQPVASAAWAPNERPRTRGQVLMVAHPLPNPTPMVTPPLSSDDPAPLAPVTAAQSQAPQDTGQRGTDSRSSRRRVRTV